MPDSVVAGRQDYRQYKSLYFSLLTNDMAQRPMGMAPALEIGWEQWNKGNQEA